MNSATQEYIRQHTNEDVRRLALQGTKNPEVDLPWALDQIAGRQQARTKLPTWAAIEGIIYPPHLSMEQCSSEQTARYKASIAGEGAFLVDLTAGFGVDMAFLSQQFQHAVHVERQEQLCTISSENYRQLGLNHIEVVRADGVDYLHQLDHADLIFLDPARRDKQGSRTYSISDCTPNVLEIMDELLEKAERVLLKLSPMLDWRKAVADILSPLTIDHSPLTIDYSPLTIDHSSNGEADSSLFTLHSSLNCEADSSLFTLHSSLNLEVHIVSVGNECKELLILLGRPHLSSPIGEGRLVCVNDNSLFETSFSVDDFSLGDNECRFASKELLPYRGGWEGSFLYEPNASIMKAGCFGEVAARFGVSPLSANSHLFVSPHFIEDFPGRKFQISAISSTNKRELKTALAGLTQANITVRNFPMTVAELRRRLKLSDGGDTYIFATTLADNRHVLLICSRR